MLAIIAHIKELKYGFYLGCNGYWVSMLIKNFRTEVNKKICLKRS